MQILLSGQSHDHGVDDAGRVRHRSDPLVENHVIHETEEANHENHHWYTFARKVDLLSWACEKETTKLDALCKVKGVGSFEEAN